MIYVIMGPTCSGKTSLANYLMDKLNCDAINFDAFQIYQDMNVGTAKLDKDDPHYSRYHLLDILAPDQTFSVMEYQSLCRKEIKEQLSKDENVVLVGGTGLYARAVIYDYVFNIEEDNDTSIYDDLTNEQLFEKLQSLDPEAATKIHVNNRKRLIRALVLIKNANEKKSDIINKQEHKPIYPNVRFIFLSPEREQLYSNIDNRVIKMMENGLIDEVKSLLNKYDLSLTARQGIGYKEVISFINKEIDYDECIKLIQKRTRNYAKRQVTFFKNQFNCETYASMSEAIKNI